MSERKKKKARLRLIALEAVDAVTSNRDVWPVATAITVTLDEGGTLDSYSISGLTKQQAVAIVYAILKQGS